MTSLTYTLHTKGKPRQSGLFFYCFSTQSDSEEKAEAQEAPAQVRVELPGKHKALAHTRRRSAPAVTMPLHLHPGRSCAASGSLTEASRLLGHLLTPHPETVVITIGYHGADVHQITNKMPRCQV